MATVSNLVVKVTADKANFDRGIAGVNSTVRKVEGNALRASSAVNKLAVAFVAFGAASALKSAISLTVDFNQAIADLSAITGATGKDLAFYRDQAEQIGRTTSLSASQAAAAFKLIASAKPDLLKSAEALNAVTREAVTLAEATGQDLPIAAQALGSALNQFQLPASNASDVINILAASSKLGTAEVSNVTEALRNAGSAANSLGLDFAETVAGIQGLAKAGVQGADAGTKLRQVLLKLEKTGNSKLQPSVVGLVGALKELKSQNLSNAKLMKIFGEEGFAAATALLTTVDTVDELNSSLRNTNTATEQAATRMDTLRGDTLELKSAIEGLAIGSLSGEFGDLSRTLVQTSTKGVNSLTENLDTLADIGQVVALLIGSRLVGSFAALTVSTVRNTAATLTAVPASTGLSAAMGVQAASATRSTIAMNASVIAATKLRVAMALIGGPVGLAVLAAGAVALYASKSDVATESIEQMSIRLKELKGDFEGVQLATLEGSLTSIQSTIRTLREEIEKTSQSSLTTGGLGGETEKIKEYTAKLDLAKQTQLQLLENIAKLNTKPKDDSVDGAKGGKSPAATAIEETKTEAEKLKAVIEGLESNSAWQSLFGTAKTEVRSAQFDQYAKLVKANIESGDSFTQHNLKTLKNILQVSKNNAGTAFSTQGKFEKVDIAGMTSVVAGLEALIKDRGVTSGDAEKSDITNKISELVDKNSQTVTDLLELQQQVPKNSETVNKLLELQQSAPTTKVELKIVTPKGEIVEVVLASPKFAEAVTNLQVQNNNNAAKAGE